MRVTLLKNARIWHKAGETVDVSPEESHFLLTTDGAVIAEAVKAPAVKSEIETPEEKIPEVEIPEKVRTVKKAVKKAVTKKK